jgi:hypothetical protein
MTDVTVVFVNYKMKDDILRAAAAVLSDLLDSSLSAEVVVVDNSQNSDGIREALALSLPHVRYVDAGGNVGFGKGNTIGFKAYPARYYFALNRDTDMQKGAKVMERLVAFMDANPLVGICGPKLVYPDGRLQYSCYRFDLPSLFIKPFKQARLDEKLPLAKKLVDRLQMTDFDHASTRPVDWVLGAALLVRGEAIQEVGWFDERYFMYLEDCDWCRTMWERGWKVYYVHDVEITHVHERQSDRVPGILSAILKNKLARVHGASWLRYLSKWAFKHRNYAE